MNNNENTKNMVEIYKKYKTQINTVISIISILLLINGSILDSVISGYLGYKSVITIDDINSTDNTNNENDKSKLQSMLKMWGCYSMCNIFEKILLSITFLYPLTVTYYFAKIGLFFWLFNSEDNINIFYDTCIQFTYRRYKNVIQYVFSQVEVVSNIVFKIGFDSVRHVQDNVLASAINRMDEETVLKITSKLNETKLENTNDEDKLD
jgi:hypothetical protein